MLRSSKRLQPPAVADGEDSDWERHQRRNSRGAAAVQSRVPGGVGDGQALEGALCPRHPPVQADATGTPRASATRDERPSTAGAVHLPNRCRTVVRWAVRAARLTRPRPPPAASPVSTTRPRTISTSERRASRGDLELGELAENLGSKGLVGEDLESPVLRQKDQGHQQAAPQDRDAGLHYRDPPKRLEPGSPRGSCDTSSRAGSAFRRLEATGR